jgi:hypothetical protein
VRRAGVAAILGELRSLGQTVREELEPPRVGPIVVSGVLAEQLAKQLGADAAAGSVAVGTGVPPANTSALVHVIAGDPSDEDVELVRTATTNGVAVVIVELWPQEDWTRPFVLSPFVVECRAGEGFPVREIADRISEATEDSAALAAAVPAIRDAAWAGVVKQAVVRSALIGLAADRFGASRPLISLEQVRMTGRLRRMTSADVLAEDRPMLAGTAAAVIASGFAFRHLARGARGFLPDPVAHAAVAAGGTLLLARAVRLLEGRMRRD